MVGWVPRGIGFNVPGGPVFFRGYLPHYKQLNFGGGRDWLGATAAALVGTTQAGDKNNVALKSRVLPHDELPLVFPWKFVWC